MHEPEKILKLCAEECIAVRALVVVIAILLFHCAPSRVVRPLKANEQVVGLSLGGPLIGYSGLTIPMPLTTVHYARGITDKTTAFGSLHTTSLLYGVFQTDLGVCTQLFHSDIHRLGITANPIVNLAVDRWEKHLKVWPQLDVNAYWELHPGKSFLYAGVSNWFELSKYRADGEPQTTHWLCNPQLGFNYAHGRWNFVLEGKYLAPGIHTVPNAVDYTGIGGKGALGIYLGFTRKLK